VPVGPLWLHEIKHDGYRLRVRKPGDRSAFTLGAERTGRTVSPSLKATSTIDLDEIDGMEKHRVVIGPVELVEHRKSVLSAHHAFAIEIEARERSR
jgi:hypothetical protein